MVHRVHTVDRPILHAGTLHLLGRPRSTWWGRLEPVDVGHVTGWNERSNSFRSRCEVQVRPVVRLPVCGLGWARQPGSRSSAPTSEFPVSTARSVSTRKARVPPVHPHRATGITLRAKSDVLSGGMEGVCHRIGAQLFVRRPLHDSRRSVVMSAGGGTHCPARDVRRSLTRPDRTCS